MTKHHLRHLQPKLLSNCSTCGMPQAIWAPTMRRTPTPQFLLLGFAKLLFFEFAQRRVRKRLVTGAVNCPSVGAHFEAIAWLALRTACDVTAWTIALAERRLAGRMAGDKSSRFGLRRPKAIR